MAQVSTITPAFRNQLANKQWMKSTAGEFSSVEPVSDVSLPDAIPSTVERLEQIEAFEVL
jgi:hypothetical protein